MEEKKNPNAMSEEELEEVSGGVGGGSGYYMTVGNGKHGCLRLQELPNGDFRFQIETLLPGLQVFTYGETASGIGRDGVPCKYRRVCHNRRWGWAEDSCLLR